MGISQLSFSGKILSLNAPHWQKSMGQCWLLDPTYLSFTVQDVFCRHFCFHLIFESSQHIKKMYNHILILISIAEI